MRYPVFLKDLRVFKTCLWIRVRDRSEINIAQKRKKSENVRDKICYKTDKTTENVARYVRRMDTYEG